ncbi:monooxygenase fmaE [Aspergillus mulundensis]|uniref:Uncharacterized protein n=1 Tax=Aspergillus mulundensis TaxID=1810919 RepID=A0A3D8SL56_9EURO|nr:Uncharacterized protein DSM5745_03699 [Aspergillus mulundensis]RDW87057.1 Uncharacterized protein DSM5745_03699 [Aspergillus mulundensis]
MAPFKPLLPNIPTSHARKATYKPSTTELEPRENAPLPIRRPSPTVILRDGLTLSTWLLVGGVLQGLAIRTMGYKSLLPAALILSYRALDTALMTLSLKKNHYMDDVIMRKYSAQYPTNGSFASTTNPNTGQEDGDPASTPLVVFHLGAKCNHPLGLLAPGFKELGDWAERLYESLRVNPSKYGLLGMTRFVGAAEASGNETLSVMYFRDYEGLHAFAHDLMHAESVRWWSGIVKRHPHLAIWHETYVVPRGCWENIYAQAGVTGMGDTFFPVVDKEGDGEVKEWARGVVDARGGALRTGSRRLRMAHLEEKEKELEGYYDMTDGGGAFDEVAQ